MVSSVRSFVLDGIEARPVQVDVDVHRGLPSFAIVGLPDAAVRESRERIRAALINSGFEFPLQRIVVNLAPASMRKAGPGLDLAIAVGLLAASMQMPAADLRKFALVGELALDGRTRSVSGALAFAEAACKEGIGIVAPDDNAAEAALATGVDLRPLAALGDLPSLVAGPRPVVPPAMPLDPVRDDYAPDLSEMRGQRQLRRALEVAAVGSHSLLIVGPPGAGGSLAAGRLPSILPPLSHEEALEVVRIASACGWLWRGFGGRPFRAPHYTIGPVGLLGGGRSMCPGEVTIAHRGVLFLDGLTEFPRATLEALREVRRSGMATIARGHEVRSFPAGFLLVATAPPCPCGRGDGDRDCPCSPLAVRHHRDRLLSIAEDFDIRVAISPPTSIEFGGPPAENSEAVRDRVVAARAWRVGRNERGTDGDLDERAGATLRVARTIADLEGAEIVRGRHAKEALILRSGIV